MSEEIESKRDDSSSSRADIDPISERLKTSLASIEQPFDGIQYDMMKITVDDPQTKNGTGFSSFSSYVTYAVSLAPKLQGVINVRRRYRDFQWLRDTFRKLFPGYFVPPLPGKKALGNYNDDWLEERMEDLERFLNRVCKDTVLCDSLPFKLFLSRHENSFDDGKKDVESILFPEDNAGNASLTVARFSKLFGKAVNSPLPDSLNEEMLRLKEFLQSSEKELAALLDNSRLMRNKLQELHAIQKLFSEQLALVSKVEMNFAQRPDPPKIDVLGIFENQASISVDEPGFVDSTLVVTIRHELQDVLALLEILAVREDLNATASKAWSRADKWRVMEKSQQDVLNEKQLKTKEEEIKISQELQSQAQAIDKVIRCHSMPLAWNCKVTSFRQAISTFASSQVDVTKKHLLNWQTLAQHAK